MISLIVIAHTDGVTAIEYHVADGIKYIETFPTWDSLLYLLSRYMTDYVVVEIRWTDDASCAPFDIYRKQTGEG